jgi:hypothetical protein
MCPRTDLNDVKNAISTATHNRSLISMSYSSIPGQDIYLNVSSLNEKSNRYSKSLDRTCTMASRVLYPSFKSNKNAVSQRLGMPKATLPFGSFIRDFKTLLQPAANKRTGYPTTTLADR